VAGLACFEFTNTLFSSPNLVIGAIWSGIYIGEDAKGAGNYLKLMQNAHHLAQIATSQDIAERNQT
jgi:hypothetical protein